VPDLSLPCLVKSYQHDLALCSLADDANVNSNADQGHKSPDFRTVIPMTRDLSEAEGSTIVKVTRVVDGERVSNSVNELRLSVRKGISKSANEIRVRRRGPVHILLADTRRYLCISRYRRCTRSALKMCERDKG
jgi:hypothetical protein